VRHAAVAPGNWKSAVKSANEPFVQLQTENQGMTKTNLMLATALALVLAACAKQEAPAPAAADASVDAAEAAGEAVADAATGSDLPQACSDYLARARACFEKAGNNAALASFQEGVDMAEAEWNKVEDKSALASACEMANDNFAAAVTALQCE